MICQHRCSSQSCCSCTLCRPSSCRQSCSCECRLAMAAFDHDCAPTRCRPTAPPSRGRGQLQASPLVSHADCSTPNQGRQRRRPVPIRCARRARHPRGLVYAACDRRLFRAGGSKGSSERGWAGAESDRFHLQRLVHATTPTAATSFLPTLIQPSGRWRTRPRIWTRTVRSLMMTPQPPGRGSST